MQPSDPLFPAPVLLPASELSGRGAVPGLALDSQVLGKAWSQITLLG